MAYPSNEVAITYLSQIGSGPRGEGQAVIDLTQTELIVDLGEKEHKVEVVNTQDAQRSPKGWYGTAIAVGILIVIGVGGFGITGLLQSYGVCTFPPALHWLSVAMQTVGNAAPLNGCLWLMAAGGVVVGGGIITWASISLCRTKSMDATSRETASTTSIAEISSTNNRKVDVRGTVYIHSLTSGPIRYDQMFGFSQRLCHENGSPIAIAQDDYYLELSGTICETGIIFEPEFKFLAKDGSSLSNTYLPASLFKNVKEGGSIRFIFDGKLVELTCCQATHLLPSATSSTFEEMLADVESLLLSKQTHSLFVQDLQETGTEIVKKSGGITLADFRKSSPPKITDSQPRFMGQLLGQKHVKLDPLHQNNPLPIDDFKVYEEDQKEIPYKELEVLDVTRDRILFNLHHVKGVDISEIDLIESTGIGGVHQLWIIIPNKPEKNKFASICGKEFTPDQLNIYPHNSKISGGIRVTNPKRVFTYFHGQYYMIKVNKEFSIHLAFNEEGYLQLDLARRD